MKTRSSSRRFFLLVFALILPPLLCGVSARAQSITATWMHNQLALAIPYKGLHAGSGALVVELLNPEDRVLCRVEQNAVTAEAGGAWKAVLTPADPVPFDDLVWERVRIRFTFAGESAPAFDEIRTVSDILIRLVVHILGQSSYLAGSQAVVRVLVTGSDDRPIPGASSLRIELVAPNQSARTLFAGPVNRRGTVDAHLQFPASLAGDVQLHFVAETPIGATEFTQSVRLEDKVSILLTTEKPLYQPGQTIHIRALALNRADRRAASGPLTFEIEDARGNKIFRKNTATDAFGIASAEFTLADEVNLGAWHLHAYTGDPAEPTNSAELAFTVDRYVLPKFKVSIDFTAENGKPRRDYRPGDHVTGVLHANYFFGEPVANAPVTLSASAIDVALANAGSATGTTDKDGAWRFDLQLPAYFTGHPLANGAAPVLVQATVKDASGHEEARGEPITVSQSSILVTAVPEGGALIPGLENQIFLLASYPDGSPAQATLTVRSPETLHHIPLVGEKSVWPRTVQTDAGGVAVINFVPTAEAATLDVDADDASGNHASAQIPLQSRDGADQILLRTDRSVLKVGDRLDLTVLSTSRTGTAYIDLVRDGQTILTRDVDLAAGQATLSLAVTPQMTGTLQIHAYRFAANAQAIGDQRLVFVQPAEELHIETTADAPEYKPGAEARIHFRVTDEHGGAVHAALGLEVVDEAVFALAEKQPGFAKVFFYLEQELLKPRYEIHSLSMNGVVAPANSSSDQDRDAGALFSAMEYSNPNDVDAEFGRDLPQTKAQEYRERYQKAFEDQAIEIANRINQLNGQPNGGSQGQGEGQNNGQSASRKTMQQLIGELEKSDPALARDAWGTPIRFEPQSWSPRNMLYVRLTSAGPSRDFNSGDHLEALLEARTGTIVGSPGQRPLNIKIEHDRGPANGLAQVTGVVTDASGAVIPGATVTLREAHSRKERKAITDGSGAFTFSALPPAEYRVQISALGFESATGRLTVQPRDMAVVSSTLNVGASTETVEVMNAAPMMEARAMAAPVPARPNAVFGVMGGPAALSEERERFAQEDSLEAKKSTGAEDLSAGQSAAAPQTHIRSYFPEALYINPEILTDAHGEASIVIPIADSITT